MSGAYSNSRGDQRAPGMRQGVLGFEQLYWAAAEKAGLSKQGSGDATTGAAGAAGEGRRGS